MRFSARSARIAAAALLAAAGFVFGAQGVVAEEAGTFRMLVSGVSNYTTIDHAGAKVTGGYLKGTVTVLQSSGGTFAEGASHLVTCVAYATISEADTDVRGACTITDGSGDNWFALAKRSVGDIEAGGGGDGRWELTGGTGKYAGLSGNCLYKTEYLPENHVVSSSECTWKQ